MAASGPRSGVDRAVVDHVSAFWINVVFYLDQGT